MPTIKSYSGSACKEGVLVSFTGIHLNTDETYSIAFSANSRIPPSDYELYPTGFIFKPSTRLSNVSTFFSAANPYTLYNSSSNIIKLSVFNNSNQEIYRDYTVVKCGNLSQDPVRPSATPTVTPTNTTTPTITASVSATPTITPTVTQTSTPSPTPPLGMTSSFPQFITKLPNCGTNVIYAIAGGKIGQTYNYRFSTDMTAELELSNPTGTITITNSSLVNNVYTVINLKQPCLNYSVKFGVSDGTTTVESIAFFVCGNCP